MREDGKGRMQWTSTGARPAGEMRVGGVLQLVVFMIAGQRYALQLQRVERVLPIVAISSLPQAPAITLGVINLHGSILAIVDLRRRFNLPPHEYGLTGHLLLVRTIQRRLGFPVDEVLGVMEVAAEGVTPPHTVLPGIGHVAGIVTLADGLLFLHDLDTVLSLHEEQSLSRALEEMEG
ncbi:MAG: chemotaxis protein CheW [Candidatus Entotheonellia bacterium]